VGGHIFYRMRGWAGERAALTGRPSGGEQLDPRIASFPEAPQFAASDTNMAPETTGEQIIRSSALPPAKAATPRLEGISTADLKGNVIRLVNPELSSFVLKLDPGAFSGSYAVVAYSLCRARPDCLVLGWRAESLLPSSMPNASRPGAGLSFMFRKDGVSGMTQIFWDCRQTPRDAASECLPGTRSA